MHNTPIAIASTGLVTAIGMNAPATCAAIRANVRAPSETKFMHSGGDWIIAHQVPLRTPKFGVPRLVRMLGMAIEEALDAIPRFRWSEIPLLLCVGEPERSRQSGWTHTGVLASLQKALGVDFHEGSATIARGRVSVALALARARLMLDEHGMSRVLIGAADSFLDWPTLSHYEQCDRLLTPTNSNGFVPGEGAGALLVRKANGDAALACHGIGFGVEKAHIDSDEPLRGDGLCDAIKLALQDAGRELHDMNYRVTDLSGEQYYFREAALALLRILRKRKEEFDIWHPAECTGELGAVTAVVGIALADAAWRKGFARGADVLIHMGNDGGDRAALVFHGGTAA